MYQTVLTTMRRKTIVVLNHGFLGNTRKALLNAAWSINMQSTVLYITFENTEEEIREANRFIDHLIVVPLHKVVSKDDLEVIIAEFNSYHFDRIDTVIIDKPNWIMYTGNINNWLNELSDTWDVNFVIAEQEPNESIIHFRSHQIHDQMELYATIRKSEKRIISMNLDEKLDY